MMGNETRTITCAFAHATRMGRPVLPIDPSSGVDFVQGLSTRKRVHGQLSVQVRSHNASTLVLVEWPNKTPVNSGTTTCTPLYIEHALVFVDLSDCV